MFFVEIFFVVLSAALHEVQFALLTLVFFFACLFSFSFLSAALHEVQFALLGAPRLKSQCMSLVTN